MNTELKNTRHFARGALFSAILVANGAAAAALEEIVVTAQKRSENLQETPLSIQALTAADIENKGVNNIADLMTAAPGLSGYEAPSSRGNISISMRGIAAGNPNSVSIDPSNAIYIDGVYLGKSAGNGVDAMDLERIEVLKGPQGTLYGRNSTGGAVNFITKKPQEELGAKFKVSAGDYDHREISGRVDVPLTETLGMSLSGYSRERDHLYENSRPGGDDFENIDRAGGRFALSWRPADNITVDYAYSYDEIDENAQALHVTGFNPLGAGVLAADGFPTNVAIDSRDRLNAVAQTKAFLPFLGAAYNTPEVQQLDQWMGDYIAYANNQLQNLNERPSRFDSDRESISTNEVDGHSLTVAWQVDDLGVLGDVEFKSITGWREVENLNENDLDGMNNSANGGVIHDLTLLTIGGLFFDSVSPFIPAGTEFATGQALVNAILERGNAPVFNNFATIEHQQYSQELQMVGSTNSLEYAVGLYYYEDESDFRNNRTPLFPIAFSESSSHDLTTEAESIFGQVTWTPGGDSPWSFTGGLRYTHEKKTIEYLWRSSQDPLGFFGPVFAGQSPAVTYTSNDLAQTQPKVDGVYGREFDEDFYNLSGKFTVQYFLNNDINVYATYSTGYRSGGFNGDFFDTENDTADSFDEETIENMELGFKSNLLDGRARLNAAVYTYTYEDLQVSQLLPQESGSVTSSITNAGEAERWGFEAALQYAATDYLTLNLAYNYIQGDYEEFPPVVGSPLDGGAVLPTDNLGERAVSPGNQVQGGFDWRIYDEASSSLRLFVNAMWQEATTPIAANVGVYDTNGNSLPDTPVVFEQRENDARTIVNGRLAWTAYTGNGDITVALWGKNLLDDEHQNFAFNYGPSLGLNAAQYGEPRTWGVDFVWEL